MNSVSRVGKVVSEHVVPRHLRFARWFTLWHNVLWLTPLCSSAALRHSMFTFSAWPSAHHRAQSLCSQAFYVPFAFVAINVLLGESFVPDIAGIVVGHIYYFLKELYPLTSGRQVRGQGLG